MKGFNIGILSSWVNPFCQQIPKADNQKKNLMTDPSVSIVHSLNSYWMSKNGLFVDKAYKKFLFYWILQYSFSNLREPFPLQQLTL